MEYRRFDQVCIVRLDPGEDILEEVRAVSLAEGIRLASVQGLGAVDDFTVGVFDPVEKTYQANQFQGRYEIVSLTGTVSTMNGEYYCHLHNSNPNKYKTDPSYDNQEPDVPDEPSEEPEDPIEPENPNQPTEQ